MNEEEVKNFSEEVSEFARSKSDKFVGLIMMVESDEPREFRGQYTLGMSTADMIVLKHIVDKIVLFGTTAAVALELDKLKAIYNK